MPNHHPAPPSDQCEAASSNRLPVLAAEIRAAHTGVLDAAKTAAERSIEAGRALLEAKELVKHGEWGAWLKEHCDLPERTARLYMAIARSGLESATVADLGLKGAATAVEMGVIDYWDDLTDAEVNEWRVFALFLARHEGWHAEGAFEHTEWLRRRWTQTPTEWLFSKHRSFWFKHDLPQAWLDDWVAFRDANRERTVEEIEAELRALAETQGALRVAMTTPPKPRRKRRLTPSDPQFAAAIRSVIRSGGA